jgi:hypothetical protein
MPNSLVKTTQHDIALENYETIYWQHMIKELKLSQYYTYKVILITLFIALWPSCMSYCAKRNSANCNVLSKSPHISITLCTRDFPETKIVKFLSSPMCRRRQWGPPSCVFRWYLGYFRGVNLPGRETDSSYLITRLRISGALRRIFIIMCLFLTNCLHSLSDSLLHALYSVAMSIIFLSIFVCLTQSLVLSPIIVFRCKTLKFSTNLVVLSNWFKNSNCRTRHWVTMSWNWVCFPM